MSQKQNYLLGIYTRTPLHVGAGTSVDIVDLPIIRERITNYPIIPASAVKGVLRQEAVDKMGEKNIKVNVLFGNRDDETFKDENDKNKAYAGAMFFGEAKIIAFPVRSLKNCFAWITCPLVLQRFARDTGKKINVPKIEPDKCYAKDNSGDYIVLEEYPLEIQDSGSKIRNDVIAELKKLSDDPVWQNELDERLVITSDENFQHFVTTATEIVARIEIDPKTRTNENLFNQENIPCETLFYSVCRYLGEKRDFQEENSACKTFEKLFEDNKKVYLQFGGNETIGQGLCEVKLEHLNENNKSEN